MRALRIYATVFVVTGMAYGLVMRLLLWDEGSLAALRRGAVFGLLMAAVIGTVQVLVTRGTPPGETTSPRQRLEVAVRPDPWLADRVAAALRALPATILTADPGRGHWEARTKVNWLTFGEEVTVQLTGDRSAPMAVITSRPRVRSTLIDYGRGRKVVHRVATSLGHDPFHRT